MPVRSALLFISAMWTAGLAGCTAFIQREELLKRRAQRLSRTRSPDWSSDEKRPKRAAREMWAVMGRINTEILSEIAEFQSERPSVNCTTCHRRSVTPALDMADEGEGAVRP